MNHQPTYQQGYINGYLEGLLAFYNLRYKHANNYRNLEAHFMQSSATGDLAVDIVNGLTGHYSRSGNVPAESLPISGERPELKPLTCSFPELAKLLEPWLPNEEERVIAREYKVPPDQLPAGASLADYFLDFVLRDYGLQAGEYRYWLAICPAPLMKAFSYCSDDMFTLVLENGKEVNILHFVRKVIYS